MHRRADIQGLRAVAVLSVVLAHAGVPLLDGGFVGVDLFFVVSGFLITGLLIREAESSGRIQLPQFWARRVRRLLPVSALVLVVTAVAASVVLPLTQRVEVAADTRWSAMFAANWRFAMVGTDYFASDRPTSPLQHYWSLAVEEQFYFVWPFLLAGLASLAVKRRSQVRRLIGPVAGVIALLSFGYAWWLTGVNQPLAYFGTPARAWQLAAGALLACCVPLLSKISALARQGLAIVGIVGFGLAVVFVSDSGSGYPGWIALVPTLSAGMLIAAGVGGPTFIGKALSTRPAVWFGDISYSLYLWHFPVLILGVQLFEPAGWFVSTGLVAVSIALAATTYWLVEQPFRKARSLVSRPPWVSLAVGILLVAISVSAAGIVQPKQSEIDALTAVTGLDGNAVQLGTLLTDPAQGFATTPDCTLVLFEDANVGDDCSNYGAPNGPRHVVVLGDSHAVNLVPGLDPAARAANWRMTLWAKSSCHFADVTIYDQTREAIATACDAYREEALQKTIDAQPDLVVIASARFDDRIIVDRDTGEHLTGQASFDMIVDGWRRGISRLVAAGVPVVLIQDWPRAPERPADCLLSTHHVADCVFAESGEASLEPIVVEQFASDQVKLVELHSDFCQDTVCTPVVGDLLVYRDAHHLTYPYMESRRRFFAEQVLAAFD